MLVARCQKCNTEKFSKFSAAITQKIATNPACPTTANVTPWIKMVTPTYVLIAMGRSASWLSPYVRRIALFLYSFQTAKHLQRSHRSTPIFSGPISGRVFNVQVPYITTIHAQDAVEEHTPSIRQARTKSKTKLKFDARDLWTPTTWFDLKYSSLSFFY
jgi:hypothetical protein